mmetsp:Transcript_65403/g.156205  ORF Transcript_65403/g.156205 Transcript_65403/m.156205 type:complete len:250 (-) Transcript_65403:87-836(-)
MTSWRSKTVLDWNEIFISVGREPAAGLYESCGICRKNPIGCGYCTAVAGMIPFGVFTDTVSVSSSSVSPCCGTRKPMSLVMYTVVCSCAGRSRERRRSMLWDEASQVACSTFPTQRDGFSKHVAGSEATAIVRTPEACLSIEKPSRLNVTTSPARMGIESVKERISCTVSVREGGLNLMLEKRTVPKGWMAWVEVMATAGISPALAKSPIICRFSSFASSPADGVRSPEVASSWRRTTLPSSTEADTGM